MRKIDQAVRKLDILEASAALAKDMGLMNIRREHVAGKLGIAEGLIVKPFGDMYKLRKELVGYAVEHGITEIIAEALVSRDTPIRNTAKKAPDELKRRVVESLI